MTAPRPKESWWHRGYSGVGKEQISQMVSCMPGQVSSLSYRNIQIFDPEQIAQIRKTTPDYKEAFDIGTCLPDARLPNVWLPEHILPGFRTYAMSFFDECRALQIKVLRALAIGLPGVEDVNFFEKYHEDVANQLRLLHYPGAATEVFSSGTKGRSKAHTVCSRFIFLINNMPHDLATMTRTLERVHSSSRTLKIPAGVLKSKIHILRVTSFQLRPYPDLWSSTLVICLCAGQMVIILRRGTSKLTVQTNWFNIDTLKSTLHRVRPPPPIDGESFTPERFSIPYVRIAISWHLFNNSWNLL